MDIIVNCCKIGGNHNKKEHKTVSLSSCLLLLPALVSKLKACSLPEKERGLLRVKEVLVGHQQY